MSKFQVVAAPGGFHACRRMKDGALLSIVECPTREAAEAECVQLDMIATRMAQVALYPTQWAGRRIPLGHVQAAQESGYRATVRWFSDAEAV